MRFSAVPDAVEVHIIERPGLTFLGCGEAAQGPGAAAIANAIAAATGRRLRNPPLTCERIKAAMGNLRAFGQRNEFCGVPGDEREAARLPVGLGRFDAVLAR